VVNDADAGSALATWDQSDLQQVIYTVGGTPVTIANDLGNNIYLAVAWAPVGTLVPTGAYTLKGSTFRITNISSNTEYKVVAFFTDVEYTGTYIQTTGIHIPTPLACSTWHYYNKLPLMDRGSYVLQGELTLHLRMEVLQSLSYSTLGIQFSANGTTWSNTVSIYSSAGTLNKGTTLSSDTIRIPIANMNYFRIVWNTYTDPQTYTPQTSPTD
jgi:hypothetical protein